MNCKLYRNYIRNGLGNYAGFILEVKLPGFTGSCNKLIEVQDPVKAIMEAQSLGYDVKKIEGPK